MNTVGLSLAIATAATFCVCLMGIPLAYRMARADFRGKSALETLLTLPLVLPPTVVGYVIVTVLGTRGWLGRWLADAFAYSVLFSVEGAVLAAAVVAFPLFYLPTRAAFRSIEPGFADMAALLGATRTQIFWHVSLPCAAHGILSGVVLCFARALGEFGATVMVFGWRPGRLTMPIAIYSAYEQGELNQALPLVLTMTAICFVLLIVYDRVSGRR